MLVLAMGIVWLAAAEAQPAGVSKAAAVEIMGYLPSKGFTPSGSAEHFVGKKLFDYMNGGAELYLAYGFVDLAVREYEFEGENAFVALYRMQNPAGAYGIHLTAASGQKMGLGEVPAIYSRGMISFFKGKFYVRVVSRSQESGEKSKSFLSRLARSTVLRLPGSAKSPIRIKSLLPDGYTPGTLRYLVNPETARTIWFGDEGRIVLSEKAWALTAFYPEKEGDIQLTRASYPQKEAAVSVCRKLADELGLSPKNDPKGCCEAKGKGSDELYHAISVRGASLGWVAAAPDETTAVTWIKKINLAK